jgi:hypothetical protein
VIREERDWTFWDAIAQHPEVRPHLLIEDSQSLSEIVQHPSVKPYASENGGFLFCRLDGLGRVYELHTLYCPNGWGREVAKASKSAFERVFNEGAQLVTTYEVAGNWRSRPPLSHGWKQAGPFQYSDGLAADVRSWVLTYEAWCASPARKRHCQLPQQSPPLLA